MTEDSLSNDEYDCVSPDDISLPPLAETPESNIFQSDVEEGFCFSSHSVHISQYSHHSEHSGTGPGALRQLRVSSRTESCPTPPTSHHSSTRSVLRQHTLHERKTRFLMYVIMIFATNRALLTYLTL